MKYRPILHHSLPSISPITFYQSHYLLSVPLPSISPITFYQSYYLLSVLLPSISPITFYQSHYLLSVLLPSISPITFYQSHYLLLVPLPSISPITFYQSHYLLSVPLQSELHQDKLWRITEPELDLLLWTALWLVTTATTGCHCNWLLVAKMAAIYGIRRFVTVLTTACHRSLY
jgi:hypothetical protein